MGTPDFAVQPLKKLIENNFNIVAVITAPDKPAGRGHQLSESPVKKYAVQNNIPVIQPTNLKAESFLEELKQYKANLHVVVAFRMLPKCVWDMPEFGTFNLHASLLPQYRGAAPINWAIINGEKESGVTTFFINENIDTGNIIFQEKVKIPATQTAGELHDALMNIGADLVVKTCTGIANNNISTIPQDSISENLLKPAPKIFKDTCRIFWQKENDVNEIYNKIRGFSPYPGAWFTMIEDNKTISPIKIFSADKEIINHNHKIGSLIQTKEQLGIYCNNGIIYINEILMPGKKKMKITDFLKGYKFSESAYCE